MLSTGHNVSGPDMPRPRGGQFRINLKQSPVQRSEMRTFPKAVLIVFFCLAECRLVTLTSI